VLVSVGNEVAVAMSVSVAIGAVGSDWLRSDLTPAKNVALEQPNPRNAINNSSFFIIYFSQKLLISNYLR
jgi:hypothetical protein